MRLLRAAAGLALLAGLSCAALASDCAPIENVSAIADRRIIFVGELHGTAESPRFVASLACELLKRGRGVVLAMEIPGDFQPDIDAAMNEAEASSARERLERMRFWDSKMQDGRRSVAWLELLLAARELKRVYPAFNVVAMDAPGTVHFSKRDEHMAARIRELSPQDSSATVIALAGNLHAQRTVGTPWDKEFRPAAYLLRDADLVALDVSYEAGTAWFCTRDACGVNRVSSQAPSGRKQTPRIVLVTGDGRYDGRYELGEVSASLPVRKPPVASATP